MRRSLLIVLGSVDLPWGAAERRADKNANAGSGNQDSDGQPSGAGRADKRWHDDLESIVRNEQRQPPRFLPNGDHNAGPRCLLNRGHVFRNS